MKPVETGTNRIYAGSSFYEFDTKRIYRYASGEWRIDPLDTTVADLLASLIVEVRGLREIVELVANGSAKI